MQWLACLADRLSLGMMVSEVAGYPPLVPGCAPQVWDVPQASLQFRVFGWSVSPLEDPESLSWLPRSLFGLLLLVVALGILLSCCCFPLFVVAVGLTGLSMASLGACWRIEAGGSARSAARPSYQFESPDASPSWRDVPSGIAPTPREIASGSFVPLPA